MRTVHIVSHRGSRCLACVIPSMHVHLCVVWWLFSSPVSFSSPFRCSSSRPSRCLPPSSTRSSSPKTCATSAWGPWPVLTTRHPSHFLLQAWPFTVTLPEPHPFCLALAGSTSGRSCGNRRDDSWRHEVVCGRRPFQTSADAEQTRALVNCARKDFGRSDIADSWIVARHFCLRYGAEVVPMQTAGNHSAVHVAEEKNALPVVTFTLFRRKMHNSPVTVVRRCICKLQGRTLCGACVLKTRVGNIRLFPHVSYTEGLAYLKAAAMHLRLERASEWGTHAFRRGWANEALRAGGATALFYSGGWRGVAAFSYVKAKARGAVEAAEWLVEFSDSSDGDIP